MQFEKSQAAAAADELWQQDDLQMQCRRTSCTWQALLWAPMRRPEQCALLRLTIIASMAPWDGCRLLVAMQQLASGSCLGDTAFVPDGAESTTLVRTHAQLVAWRWHIPGLSHLSDCNALPQPHDQLCSALRRHSELFRIAPSGLGGLVCPPLSLSGCSTGHEIHIR